MCEGLRVYKGEEGIRGWEVRGRVVEDVCVFLVSYLVFFFEYRYSFFVWVFFFRTLEFIFAGLSCFVLCFSFFGVGLGGVLINLR